MRLRTLPTHSSHMQQGLHCQAAVAACAASCSMLQGLAKTHRPTHPAQIKLCFINATGAPNWLGSETHACCSSSTLLCNTTTALKCTSTSKKKEKAVLPSAASSGEQQHLQVLTQFMNVTFQTPPAGHLASRTANNLPEADRGRMYQPTQSAACNGSQGHLLSITKTTIPAGQYCLHSCKTAAVCTAAGCKE